MKDMKVPTDKDDLIKYLMDRLDYSEQAIEEAENCITNERAKRIQLKDEMKKLNEEIGMFIMRRRCRIMIIFSITFKITRNYIFMIFQIS
jgi:hypothetical protein